MDIETYERSGYQQYVSLAKTVGDILSAVLSRQPSLRLQQIQHRAKEPVSLRKKLEASGASLSASIEQTVKDLAGCRIVFYTNNDVSAFVGSHAIFDNFDIDWERTKYHYPTGQDATENFFISYNFVVKLKSERAALPEYAHLDGLWCEIQIQATLHHAWSEMAHDTIYKPPVVGFGTSVLKEIEKRMNEIMRNYLLPASFDFQKVSDDMQRLAKGRELHERQPLQLLVSCTDNNERYGLLDEFRRYVLPLYDDLVTEVPAIQQAVIECIVQARLTETVPIVSSGMSFRGWGAAYVVSTAFDILDMLRFQTLEALDTTFDAICTLYPGALSDDERNRIVRSARELAKNHLRVWQSAGPAIQVTMAKRIAALSVETVSQARPVLIEMLRELLDTEVSGTTSSFDAVTIHQGVVFASEELREVRRIALDELKKLFVSASSDEERLSTLRTLEHAQYIAHSHEPKADLHKVVVEDMTDVMRFLCEQQPSLSFEILESAEHDTLQLYRRFATLPPYFAENSELLSVTETLTNQIFAFRDAINADREFVIYKTLVGHEAVLAADWQGDQFDIEGEQQRRDLATDGLVAEISEANFSHWVSRIKRCAQTRSADGATFIQFHSFLLKFARSKPQLAFRLLDQLDDNLVRSASEILRGLEAGPLDAEMRVVARRWIAERRHLMQIGWFCESTEALDRLLLQDCLTAAIDTADAPAVLAVALAAAKHTANAPDLFRSALLPAVRHLSAHLDYRWLHATWRLRKSETILQLLSEADADELLAALVPKAHVDHGVEELLRWLGRRWPLKIIDFFGDRVRHDRDRDDPDKFEPVPFSLHLIPETLSEHGAAVIERVRAWFDEDSDLFEYRGGAIVSRLYPGFQPVEPTLRALVAGGQEADIRFVLRVMRRYEGSPALDETCRDIVEALGLDHSDTNSVASILDETGVVRGEFGRVEAYAGKRATLEAWLPDPREAVRTFAERHIRELDRAIAAEQRRSTEELELRKRNYE